MGSLWTSQLNSSPKTGILIWKKSIAGMCFCPILNQITRNQVQLVYTSFYATYSPVYVRKRKGLKSNFRPEQTVSIYGLGLLKVESEVYDC